MPKIPCLEYVQASSNDAALALIQSGQVDWTHNFVPNVEKAYVARDKKHFHSFYATNAYPISLAARHDEVPLQHRRASGRRSAWRSTARPCPRLGEYGYAPPTDALGLRGLFPQWVKSKAIKTRAKAMAKYSPAAARKMLTDAGFKYQGGRLIDPRGDRVELDIHVISGWSDWVASNQIITRNLRDIGIDSNVALEPDWGAWQPGAYATKFPTLLWQGGSPARRTATSTRTCPGTRTSRPGRTRHRPATGRTSPTPRPPTCSSQWKVTLVPKKQTDDRHEAPGDLPRQAPDRPAVHRPALVDVQHQVLPLLQLAEELLRRSDLHDVPRQHPVLHAHLPRREGRPLIRG